jgi:hypothetical protein
MQQTSSWGSDTTNAGQVTAFTVVVPEPVAKVHPAPPGRLTESPHSHAPQMPCFFGCFMAARGRGRCV